MDGYYQNGDYSNNNEDYSRGIGGAFQRGARFSGGPSWRGRGRHGPYRGGYRGQNRGGLGYQENQQGGGFLQKREYPVFDANDTSTWQKKDFYALVGGFMGNKECESLSFPSTLTAKQRMDVHKIAMQFKLLHSSSGSADNRVLELRKPPKVGGRFQQQLDGAASEVRVKTIDGFQGAQRLPDYFIEHQAEAILNLLKPFQLKMMHDIKVEACRAAAGGKHFNVAAPGLRTPPKSVVDKNKHESLLHFRKSLPSYKRRDDIVRAVAENDVVVVSGDTGCGKTTQIPQMLYDAGIFPPETSVICTQPRRISALSVANRVAEERGEACGDSCGYVIRFENVTSQNTRIVYATTGIVLRRLHTEPELRGVACVVVDEVHERDVETDFCLLLLRDRLRDQQLNSDKYPLKIKLVVMSATVQIEKLVGYFKDYNRGRDIPLISIPGTLFPVQQFFLEDALMWLKEPATSFNLGDVAHTEQPGEVRAFDSSVPQEESLYDRLKIAVFKDAKRMDESFLSYDLVFKLITYLHNQMSDLSGSILVFLPGWAAISQIADMLRRSPFARELSVLMLHSSLTTAEQNRVFLPPPKRYRKVVLATSIAETSITIDDVVCVIDSGFLKGTAYDPAGNTVSLQAALIGKANGVQRRGRAGRCRPGMCIHLLPKQMYDGLPAFLPPAMLSSPLEEVCLQVKAIHPYEKCLSVLQRALDAPPSDSVENATMFLTDAGAFTEDGELLTNLGRALAKLPIHPLLGKMLFGAACFGVLDIVATIAAGLSVKSPFIKPQSFQKAAVQANLLEFDGNDLSDHLCVVKLYRGWIASGRSDYYANQHFADSSTLRSLDRTKNQLIRLVQSSPLLRSVSDSLTHASRYNSNTGLARLVVLWALYPRIASVEYPRKRMKHAPNPYCWDNKPAVFSMGSALAPRRRCDIGDRGFVMYYERMQIETVLNLFDSTCVSPIDVALCLRHLTVLPLLEVPEMLLNDYECKLDPPAILDFESLGSRDDYAAMLFDGDKKLYVTTKRVAKTVQVAHHCMDYYLALAVKKLRTDLFPDDLIKAIAMTIGYPLKEGNLYHEVSPTFDNGGVSGPQTMGDENTPAFVRGGQSDPDDVDYDDDDPVMEDFDAMELVLDDEQRKRIAIAFGDLAVLRDDAANELIQAAKQSEGMRNAVVPSADVVNEAVVDSDGTRGVVDDASETH